VARSRIAGLLTICIFLTGCARHDPLLFHNEEGNYLALPAASVTGNQAQILADQYGAVIKQDSRQKITQDIEALLASEKSWVIVITPANRDFMTGIFGKIPAPSGIPSATVQVYGESTPELEKEMARLGLERSVNRRPGDDK